MYELLRNGVCLFVGSKEDCDTLETELKDYYKYHKTCMIQVKERLSGGIEQDYLTRILKDPDFMYGM